VSLTNESEWTLVFEDGSWSGRTSPRMTTLNVDVA